MRAKEFIINIPISITINSDGTIGVNQQEEPAEDTTGKFVPPLQRKLELIKKSTGVGSVYDEDDGIDD